MHGTCELVASRTKAFVLGPIDIPFPFSLWRQNKAAAIINIFVALIQCKSPTLTSFVTDWQALGGYIVAVHSRKMKSEAANRILLEFHRSGESYSRGSFLLERCS